MVKKDVAETKSSPENKNKGKKGKNVKPTDIVKPVPVLTEEDSEQRKKIPKRLPSHVGAKVSTEVVNHQNLIFNVYEFSSCVTVIMVITNA